MQSDCLILIPTYNERENITDLLEKVFSRPLAADVLVIDDNSPDGTADIVRSLQTQYNVSSDRLQLLLRPQKEGLGKAYVAGFKYALSKKYDFICQMDADFSHNPDDLVTLYHTCKNDHVDLAIGSRYLTGVNVVNWSLSRILISWGASKYVYLITKMPIKDPTAGFKCYRRQVLEKINPDTIQFVGYAFQIEMKYKAWTLGFRLKEVPIIFINRTKGKSKMNITIFKEAFWGVLSLRFQRVAKSSSANQS